MTHVVQLYRSRRRGDISSSVPFAAIGSPGDSAERELPLAPEFARSYLKGGGRAQILHPRDARRSLQDLLLDIKRLR